LKKKFLTNLALLVFLNLLIKPFWFFGIEVAVQNRVGEEMYGFYFSLFNFSFILNILLDLGISNFNNRAIARDHSKASDYLSTIIPLKFILSIVYAVIVVSAALIIGYSHAQFKMLIILIINQFLSSFILYLRSNISGLQYYRTDSLLSVLDRSLMIIIIGLLLWGNITGKPFRIEWFVYAQTGSYTLTLLTTLSIVLYRVGRIRLNFDTGRLLDILRRSYPFALLILLMAFFNRVDSVMLERLLEDGKTQAGIYAQSYRILDAATQFSFLFATLLLPMFSRMIKLKQDVNDMIRLALPVLMAAAFSLAILGNFFRKDIIELLYHHHSEISYRIFGTLMIGFIFISLSYIYGTLLTANGNLRQLNILASITLLLNLSLNLILIPRYKGLGAAVASLTSQAFYAITQMILSHRIIRVSLNSDIILRLGLFLLVNAGAGFVLTTFVSSWVISILILTALCIVSAFIFRLIHVKEIIEVLKEGEG